MSVEQSWQQFVLRLRDAYSNLRELQSKGRFSEVWLSPYEVVHQTEHCSLRRYTSANGRGAAPNRPPLLLIPPLMVTAEVYDVAADASGIRFLVERGFDVYLLDFGSPDQMPEGFMRSVEDHVVWIDESIDHMVKTIPGVADLGIHLVGYSQAGLFAYAVCALRKGKNLASLVTFGSPIDNRKNLPFDLKLEDAERFLEILRRILEAPLSLLPAIPVPLITVIFKSIALRREVSETAFFVRNLHRREILEARENRRRYLGGEGFIPWSGPAFRDFAFRFVGRNEIYRGEMRVRDRRVDFSDIDLDVLTIMGSGDVFARPESVRALREVSPRARIQELELETGHFGLVVGRRAQLESWPRVARFFDQMDGVDRDRGEEQL